MVHTNLIIRTMHIIDVVNLNEEEDKSPEFGGSPLKKPSQKLKMPKVKEESESHLHKQTQDTDSRG